jgi:predicted membrane-bound mannosyltransferase
VAGGVGGERRGDLWGAAVSVEQATGSTEQPPEQVPEQATEQAEASARRTLPRFVLPRWNWVVWAVLALVLVALVLRVWDLGLRAMHHDESLHGTFSWYFSEGRGYRHDPLMHGPFQFHVIAAFFKLFGDSELVARLPSALFGTALVATPLLLRRWLGTVGVLTASLLLVVSPSLLYYSRFARNDLFIAVWTVLLIVSVWRYRDDGRLRWLLVASAALALSFATKETTYLTAALLLTYVSVTLSFALVEQLKWALSGWRRVVLGLLLAPFAWVVAALWPLTGEWRARIGWQERPREVDLLVVLGTLTGSQLAAAVQLPLGMIGVELEGDRELTIAASMVTAVVFGGAVVGLGWRWRWWALCAGLFYVIYVLLFTTGFTNLDGFGSGFWDSLDYWLAQQDVRRGEQPWFYYIMMLPIYELLTLMVGFLGGLWLVIRGDRLTAFLLLWFVGTFAVLAMAGEKMPWLTVHLALPLVFLTGRVAGLALPRMARWLWGGQAPIVAWAGAGAASSALVLLLVFTVQTAVGVSFDHPDTPIEPLIYTQTSPEVPPLSDRIYEVALADPDGGQVPVYVDTTGSLSWPWAWYLRDLEVSYVPQEALRDGEFAEGAILVTAQNALVPTDPIRFEYEEPVEYRHRWWFQESGYKSTTWESFRTELFDGSLVSDWVSFMDDRVEESTIGSFDGEVWFPK